MHLAQREVVELEGQLGRDVGVGRLLVRQGDVQAHRGHVDVGCAAVGRLHHAGAAAGADEQLFLLRLAQAVGGHDAGEVARGLVVARRAHGALGQRQGLGVAAGLGGGQLLLRDLGRDEAGAAVHHHGAVHAGGRQRQFGLEQFELEADAARFGAQQELGVGKGQAVRIGLQRLAAVGMRLQFGPGVGQGRAGGILDVLGAVHHLLLLLKLLAQYTRPPI